jgi:hypothetical protein
VLEEENWYILRKKSRPPGRRGKFSQHGIYRKNGKGN